MHNEQMQYELCLHFANKPFLWKRRLYKSWSQTDQPKIPFSSEVELEVDFLFDFFVKLGPPWLDFDGNVFFSWAEYFGYTLYFCIYTLAKGWS